MKYSNCKDINSLVKELIQEGWVFKRGKKHGKLYPPGSKNFKPVPCSPSCSMSYQKFKADIERLKRT